MPLPYHAAIYSFHMSFNPPTGAKSNHTISFQNKQNDHQLKPQEAGRDSQACPLSLCAQPDIGALGCGGASSASAEGQGGKVASQGKGGCSRQLLAEINRGWVFHIWEQSVAQKAERNIALKAACECAKRMNRHNFLCRSVACE